MAIIDNHNDVAEHARRVRVARIWAGLSREELADALGVSFVTIERTESGRRHVEPDELERIGELCGVPDRFMRYGWPGCCAPDDYLEQLYRRLDELGAEVQRLGRGARPITR